MPTVEPFIPVIDTIRDALPAVQQSVQDAFANVQADPGLPLHVAKDAFQHEREEKKREKQSALQGLPTSSVVKPKLPPDDDLKPNLSGMPMPQRSLEPNLYYFA